MPITPSRRARLLGAAGALAGVAVLAIASPATAAPAEEIATYDAILLIDACRNAGGHVSFQLGDRGDDGVVLDDGNDLELFQRSELVQCKVPGGLEVVCEQLDVDVWLCESRLPLPEDVKIEGSKVDPTAPTGSFPQDPRLPFPRR